MASNGCGLFGTLSRVWRGVAGAAPPFEGCCDEHDLAYEQVESETDRRWADEQFRRCMIARGYPVTGRVFFVLVRYGGWLSRVKRWFRRT